MPIGDPKPLDRAKPAWRDAFARALAQPDEWFVLESGVPQPQINALHRRMTAIRAGLRKWQMLDHGLSKAALEGRMQLRRVLVGVQYELQVMIVKSPDRPSDLAKAYIEALMRGEKPQMKLD